MRKLFQSSIFCFLLIFSFGFLYSDSLLDAQKLAENGETLKAIDLYREWLDSNADDEQYTDVLLSVYDLISNPVEASETIEPYITLCADPVKQFLLLYEVEFLAGNITRAKTFVDSAGELDNRVWETMLARATVDYELGLYQDAKSRCYTILLECQDDGIRMDAACIGAIILAIEGESEKGFTLLEKTRKSSWDSPDTPKILGTKLLLAHIEDNEQKIQTYFNELEKQYPESIEYAVFSDITHYLDYSVLFSSLPMNYSPDWNTPTETNSVLQDDTASDEKTITGQWENTTDVTITLNNSRPDQKADVSDYVIIQIGSYEKRTNAEKRLQDERLADFNPVIIEAEYNGKTVYRVVIENVHRNKVQETLIELKEENIEAFPRY